jgi:outer membrane protein assembly factor BamB
MGRTGVRRRAWTFLGIGAGLLVLVAAVAAFTKLDLERHQYDPERMGKLAQMDLPGQVEAPAWASDWPQWRGPNRDGVSPEWGLLTAWPANGPAVVWKKPIGRGFSSVVVARGRLYTMDEETVPAGDGTASPPRRYEAVVCLDAGTGNPIWRHRYPSDFVERFGSGPRSTPAVDDDRVYAVGATGILHCLRADTGDVVWKHDLMEEFHGRKMQYGLSFSPLVEGDLVYAMPGGPDGNAVAAFDKHTGAVVWKALDDPVGYSSPIAVTAAGVRQALFFTNTALVSLGPEDGELYWRYPWKPAGGFNIATPIAFGNYVFISSDYGKGCALLEITAEPGGAPRVGRVYEHNRMRNTFASSVRCGDCVYGFDRTDLVCMDVRTGRILWRERGSPGFGKGTLLAAGGHLVILSESGTLTLASASGAGYREEASYRLSRSKCWTVPSLAGGRLYVRDESQLVCLALAK